MKIKVPFFASGDEIIRIANKKLGKHKRFKLVKWPTDDSVRLIIFNGTVNDPENFNGKT